MCRTGTHLPDCDFGGRAELHVSLVHSHHHLALDRSLNQHLARNNRLQPRRSEAICTNQKTRYRVNHTLRVSHLLGSTFNGLAPLRAAGRWAAPFSSIESSNLGGRRVGTCEKATGRYWGMLASSCKGVRPDRPEPFLWCPTRSSSDFRDL